VRSIASLINDPRPSQKDAAITDSGTRSTTIPTHPPPGTTHPSIARAPGEPAHDEHNSQKPPTRGIEDGGHTVIARLDSRPNAYLTAPASADRLEESAIPR
jgi:hypothetical protein